jgi:predicted phosphodiesterase
MGFSTSGDLLQTTKENGTLKTNSRKTTTPKKVRKAPEQAAEPIATKREDLIEDLKRIQEEQPDATLTRNFYRVHGKFSEGVWQGFFGRFSDFRKAAGMVPEPPKNQFDGVEVSDSGLMFKGNYVFNENTDTYIVFLDHAGKRLSFSGPQMRNMKTAYSNWDGQPQTINEICRSFGIRRDWFIELKSVMGWTHDSEPFTEEEIMERPEEDMVADVLQAKRQSLFRATEKAKWLETARNADKWVNFEQTVLNPLMAHIAENAPTFKAPMLNIKAAKEKFAVVLPAFDLHYGKAGWRAETGESYSRKEARELLLHHSNEHAKFFSSFGRPDRIIVPSASDYLHIDSQHGSTTAGTPQDTDGSYAQILIEGCELAVEHAEMLAQIAPVEWIAARGNHDEDSALSVMLYVQAWFRNNKNVHVDVSPDMQRCTQYGNSALAFFHGHGIRVPNLAAVMEQKFRSIWRKTDKHYVFSGHLHHEVVREINGIKHYQVSSLSGHDRYHAKYGYVTSDRAMQSYVVSRDRGIIAEFISPVLDHKNVVTGVKVKQ